MLAAVTCGMSPVTSITEGLQQVPAATSRLTFPSPLTGGVFSRADRDHGVVPHHRALLPGEFRQHRAALHDPEGAVQSSRQAGVAAALAGAPPPSLGTLVQPQLVHNYRWGGGGAVFERIPDVL